MEGNLSKKKGLISEITDTELDYIAEKLEETLKHKADADNVYQKSEIDTLLEGKQDCLQFDSTPTQNSTNYNKKLPKKVFFMPKQVCAPCYIFDFLLRVRKRCV